VYKIGVEWYIFLYYFLDILLILFFLERGDKKSICNKFPASSSVTCMVWPKDRANDIVFGLAEGKVKMGLLKNNKSQVLYSPERF